MKFYSVMTFTFLFILFSFSVTASARSEFAEVRVSTLSVRNCKLTLVQTHPPSASGYESTHSVTLGHYKAMSRSENGELSEPLYFSKLQGFSVPISSRNEKQTTSGVFISQMKKTPGNTGVLTASFRTVATGEPRPDTGVLSFVYMRDPNVVSVRGRSKYNVMILRNDPVDPVYLFNGVMFCENKG